MVEGLRVGMEVEGNRVGMEVEGFKVDGRAEGAPMTRVGNTVGAAAELPV
jgi:hypothetical protein